MNLRRILALLAAPVLAAGIAACGSDEPAENSSAGEAPSQEQAPTEEESPAEEDSSPEQDGSEDSEPRGTVIESLWIDDSWTIQQVEEDLCEMGGGYPSQYAEQEDLFVCGPTAAGAEACALEDGTVQCIVDPVGRQAIEFDSPTAPEQLDPREDEPLPLIVELPDGAVCATISHDHDQHWEGMFSWYRCDDGSELLTPETIGETFDRGEPWTVQRSVDGAEPEETAVDTAVFAGR